MKKSTIIFLLSLGISVFGQEHSSRFSVGIKGEAGFCYFDRFQAYKDEGYSKDEMGPGHLSCGIITDIKIIKNIYLGCDLLYDLQRGGSFEKDAGFTITNYSTSGTSQDEAYYTRQFLYKSIDVPLYLKIGVCKSRTLFFLCAGMAPSKILKATYRYSYYDPFPVASMIKESWAKTEITELKNTISLSYLLGAGVRVNFRRIVLNPELRFTRFLTNEITVDNVKQNSKNYLFSISFSILFH